MFDFFRLHCQEERKIPDVIFLALIFFRLYISEKKITQEILRQKFFAYILAEKKITQEILRATFFASI